MKIMKHVTSLVLALFLVLSLSVTAFAATASVEYSGHNIFGFAPGSEFTETDLFDNFKGVMPGDTLTQKITISNTAKCCDYIKVYLRAEPHAPGSNEPLSPPDAASSNDFLSQLGMEVWNGETRIYQSTPDQPAQLTENVLLGTFQRKDSAELEVKLTVPLDLSNDYANRIGEVDWVFTVEEHNRPNTPKTGDETNILPYVALLAVGLAGMAVLLIVKRKKNQA